MILGFHRYVDEICALLGYYAASFGNCLPTFQDNISVPSSKVILRFIIGLENILRKKYTLCKSIKTQLKLIKIIKNC
jgi:hypothetical protein